MNKFRGTAAALLLLAVFSGNVGGQRRALPDSPDFVRLVDSVRFLRAEGQLYFTFLSDTSALIERSAEPRLEALLDVRWKDRSLASVIIQLGEPVRVSESQMMWSGVGESPAHGNVVISQGRNGWRGVLQKGKWAYRLSSRPDGGIAVERIDLSAMPPELPPLPAREPVTDGGKPQMVGECPDQPIDILVLFESSQLDSLLGGIEQVSDDLKWALDELRFALQKSKIDREVRLLAVMQISQPLKGNIEADLAELVRHPEAIRLRKETGADLVFFWSAHFDACGFAYQLDQRSRGMPNDAFAIVSSLCLDRQTFSHEFGHLLGAAHDPAQFLKESGAPPATDYAHGYLDPDSMFRDIMGYPCEKKECGRAHRFSSPNARYFGRPIGRKGERSTGLGSDATRTITESWCRVAAYREGPLSDKLAVSTTRD